MQNLDSGLDSWTGLWTEIWTRFWTDARDFLILGAVGRSKVDLNPSVTNYLCCLMLCLVGGTREHTNLIAT